jgi:hypothetical protein
VGALAIKETTKHGGFFDSKSMISIPYVVLESLQPFGKINSSFSI